MTRIWVDADACPREVKDMVYRTADRRQLQAILVANSYMQHPRSPYLQLVVVHAKFDEADHYIVEHARSDDLVVTADILLAERLVKQGIVAINPRGEVYTAANIGERVTIRNLMAELRTESKPLGGPSAYGEQDKKRFANALDKHVTILQMSKKNTSALPTAEALASEKKNSG